MVFPDGKRYFSMTDSDFLPGGRLQRLVVDAGFTCPNRDGTLGTGGCSFCDNAAFHPAYSHPGKPIRQQLDEGIAFHRARGRDASRYLAYFQSFSNTYGPLERLRDVYAEALSHPLCAGIVIGTRPDCVDAEKLDFLAGLMTGGADAPDAPLVIVEYGIESCHDTTLARVGRGHDFACARRAVEETAARGIPVGAHFILGLPGEDREMILASCAHINSLPLDFIKFHQLQILRGTRIEAEFAACPQDFLNPGFADYLDLLADIVERLRPDLRIGRLAASVPPRFLADGPWHGVKPADLPNLLDRHLAARGTWQGRLL